MCLTNKTIQLLNIIIDYVLLVLTQIIIPYTLNARQTYFIFNEIDRKYDYILQFDGELEQIK